MHDKTGIGFCPHCGNTTPQALVGRGIKREDGVAFHYQLTECGTCSGILLWKEDVDAAGPRAYEILSQPFARLLWPKSAELHECVPESVRRCYTEAAKIKALAPNAFANQIRRSLEAVCRDRGASQNSLASSLKELASKGDIPPVLAEMSDLIRVIGNMGSHASEDDVPPTFVPAIDDFFNAVIEYVYVGPYRISHTKSQLTRAKTLQAQPESPQPPVIPGVDPVLATTKRRK